MDAHVSSAAFSPARTEVSGSFSSSQGHWNTLWNSSPPLESDNPWPYPTSDPEFSNVSSPEAISPTSCVMDYSSPKSAMMNVHPAAVITGLGEGSSPSPRAASSSSSSSCEENGYPSSSSSNSGGAQRSKRKTRSRNPSRQRQCASEKEKLRMRDLTKALHHLRSYLPASVAPAGQTLTKIQTLRYTIRYIAHLSAQVETRDELQASGGQQSLYAPQGGFPEQQSERLTLGGCWDAFTQNTGGTDAKQAPWQRGSDLPAYHGPHSSPYDSTYEDLFNSSTDSMMQSPVYTTGAKQSYQEYDRDMTFHTISPDYWI